MPSCTSNVKGGNDAITKDSHVTCDGGVKRGVAADVWNRRRGSCHSMSFAATSGKVRGGVVPSRTFLQERVAAGEVAFFGGAMQRSFAGGCQTVGVDAEGQ